MIGGGIGRGTGKEGGEGVGRRGRENRRFSFFFFLLTGATIDGEKRERETKESTRSLHGAFQGVDWGRKKKSTGERKEGRENASKRKRGRE